jgi:hypothetical protein
LGVLALEYGEDEFGGEISMEDEGRLSSRK